MTLQMVMITLRKSQISAGLKGVKAGLAALRH
jgi:hypothetical protein